MSVKALKINTHEGVSIFSNVLEQKYKAENELERAQHHIEAQDAEKTDD